VLNKKKRRRRLMERFEELRAWQKARDLAREIYRVTASGPFFKDYGLRDQIRRAAVSIMSNIAEGFERYRPTEFRQFLSLAKASCAEVRSQLYVALDVKHLTQDDFDRLQALALGTTKIITSLRSSLISSPQHSARST
jgi:four helix bundle protein